MLAERAVLGTYWLVVAQFTINSTFTRVRYEQQDIFSAVDFPSRRQTFQSSEQKAAFRPIRTSLTFSQLCLIQPDEATDRCSETGPVSETSLGLRHPSFRRRVPGSEAWSVFDKLNEEAETVCQLV